MKWIKQIPKFVKPFVRLHVSVEIHHIIQEHVHFIAVANSKRIADIDPNRTVVSLATANRDGQTEMAQ
jgi:hypothetical protein